MYLAFTTYKQHPNISTQHYWMTRSTFKFKVIEVKKMCAIRPLPAAQQQLTDNLRTFTLKIKSV